MAARLTANLLIVSGLLLTATRIKLARSHGHQHAQPLSPREHLQEFALKCSPLQAATARSNKSFTLAAEDAIECAREPTSWRWLYVQEFAQRRVLVRESSVDERLANVQYTYNSARINYNDAFKFSAGTSSSSSGSNGGAALDDAAARTEQRVAGARVNDELCGAQLRAMLQQMDELQGLLSAKRARRPPTTSSTLELKEKFIYLARVLDSYGRYQSGHLAGRSISSGAYHQCQNGRLLLPPDNNNNNTQSLVGTRFCWARMSTRANLNEALRARRHNIEMQEPLMWSGICVPASCHTRNFAQYRHLFERLVASQYRLPESMYVDATLELDSVFCLVDHDSPHLATLPWQGRLLILLALGWFSLVLWASLRNFHTGRHNANKLALCMDIRQSWLDFSEQQPQRAVSEPQRDAEPAAAAASSLRHVDLSTLNSIKVLLCAYVVMGHNAMAHFFGAQDQLRAYLDTEVDPVSTAVLIGTFSVDTFLTITGLLLAWVLMRKMDQLHAAGKLSSTRGYAKLYASLVSMRYLRLVPLYFLIFWFKKSLFARLDGGGGPFWDYGTNVATSLGICTQSESWWTPLTLNSCHLPLLRQCLTPTYSLAIDFRLCVALAPAILLAYRWRRLGKALLVGAAAYSVVRGYQQISGLEPSILAELVNCKCQGVGQFFNKYSHLYTSPLLRLSCVSLGALAGLLLYEFQVAAARGRASATTKWPKWLRGPGTRLALAWIIFFFVLFVNTDWVHRKLTPHHRWLLLNIVAMRALWVAANCVVFLRMTTDWSHRALMRLSSMKLWKILAKLNLAILLIHWDLVLFHQNYQVEPYSLKKWNWFMNFGGVYLFSLILGTLLHLAVECPLDRLVRVYLYGERLVQLRAPGSLDKSVVGGTEPEAELADSHKEKQS